jgi:ATPase family associated with various cellular activities (AAA).
MTTETLAAVPVIPPVPLSIDELGAHARALRVQVAYAFIGQAEVFDQVLLALARRRPRADRRRARAGQDLAGARAGRIGRLHLRARPVHPRPDAGGRHRSCDLRSRRRALPDPPRPGVREPAAGRRDQPRAGEDQAALLESMQEGQVTIEGAASALPAPFMVVARRIRSSRKVPIRCPRLSSTAS